MDEEPPETELEKCAREGDLARLRELAGAGLPAGAAAAEAAERAVQNAAGCGQWECLLFLIGEMRVPVGSVDSGGVALQYAAVAGRVDVLEALVGAGAQLRGKVAGNVLLSSACTGRLEVLRWACRQEGGPAAVADWGADAAWGAAKASSWDAALELVEAGADVGGSAGGGAGARLLALAAARGQLALVGALEARGVAVASEAGAEALKFLASAWQWDDCPDAARFLIENGVDLHSEAGGMALVTAARHGDLEMVQRLAVNVAADSRAAGEALARAGELGSDEDRAAVEGYLRSLGATAPPPAALVLDADF